MSKRTKFPEGWDAARVKRVLEHYETQDDDEAVAEDEAASEQAGQTVMEVPTDLVPKVRELIAKRRKAS
jgi:hypothetical protein